MEKQTMAERRKAERDRLVETIKTKLSAEDINGLYRFFNVDDDVEVTMEDGVQSLKPFGQDGPKLENVQNLEIYATDKYAREFTQNFIRLRFNQLITPIKTEEERVSKPKTPK